MNNLVFSGPNGLITKLSEIHSLAEQGYMQGQHRIQSFNAPFCLFFDTTEKETFLVIDTSFDKYQSKKLVDEYKNLGSNPDEYKPLLAGRLCFRYEEKSLSVWAYQDSGSVNNESHEKDIDTKLKVLLPSEECLSIETTFSYAQNMG